MLENMHENGNVALDGSTRDTDIEAVDTQTMPVTGVLYDIVRREPPMPPLLGNMSTVGDDPLDDPLNRTSSDTQNTANTNSDAMDESFARPRPTAPALQVVT